MRQYTKEEINDMIYKCDDLWWFIEGYREGGGMGVLAQPSNREMIEKIREFLQDYKKEIGG